MLEKITTLNKLFSMYLHVMVSLKLQIFYFYFFGSLCCCRVLAFKHLESNQLMSLFHCWLCCRLFVGGGLGLMMGMFLGALDNPIMQEEMTGRQQFMYTMRQMGQRSWSSAKAFAVMGLIFSAAECVVEKVIGDSYIITS